MVEVLDSHMVNHDSSSRPGSLKLSARCVCMHIQNQGENGGEGIATWPSTLKGDFSLSVSFCLSGKCTRPIAKTSANKTKTKTKVTHVLYMVDLRCGSEQPGLGHTFSGPTNPRVGYEERSTLFSLTNVFGDIGL